MTGSRPSVLTTSNDCNTLSEQDEKDYEKREAVGCEFITNCCWSIADVYLKLARGPLDLLPNVFCR
jgi:hypothetical protein